MARLLVFQHVAAEPLGTLDALIRARGHRIRFVNFERQPDAEPVIDRYHGLIVLGGPMNVEDQQQRRHLRTELHAIEAALAQNKPVLGICLGAQLLAHVLGAPIRRIPQPEIGWHPLQPTEHTVADDVLRPLATPTQIFQWHSYGFEPPRSATLLATAPGWPHQAFRQGDRAYGLQFHLEMDAPLVERWLRNPECQAELAAAGLDASGDTIRRETEMHIGRMQQLAEPVFDAFLDIIGQPQRRIVLPSR
jgi:GMP synthase (glutamine-hydrolysing)